MLALMTPEERAEGVREARSRGVKLEVLVAHAMGVIMRELQLKEMARRDVQPEWAKPPQIGAKT